jgi:hypothetical protein
MRALGPSRRQRSGPTWQACRAAMVSPHAANLAPPAARRDEGFACTAEARTGVGEHLLPRARCWYCVCPRQQARVVECGCGGGPRMGSSARAENCGGGGGWGSRAALHYARNCAARLTSGARPHAASVERPAPHQRATTPQRCFAGVYTVWHVWVVRIQCRWCYRAARMQSTQSLPGSKSMPLRRCRNATDPSLYTVHAPPLCYSCVCVITHQCKGRMGCALAAQATHAPATQQQLQQPPPRPSLLPPHADLGSTRRQQPACLPLISPLRLMPVCHSPPGCTPWCAAPLKPARSAKG